MSHAALAGELYPCTQRASNIYINIYPVFFFSPVGFQSSLLKGSYVLICVYFDHASPLSPYKPLLSHTSFLKSPTSLSTQITSISHDFCLFLACINQTKSKQTALTSHQAPLKRHPNQHTIQFSATKCKCYFYFTEVGNHGLIFSSNLFTHMG